MAEEKKILFEVEFDVDKANKALVENRIALEKNRKRQSELKKELQELEKAFNKGEKSIEEYEEGVTKLTKEQIGLESANKSLADANRNLTKEIEVQANSLNALRIESAKLKKERDNLDTSTEQGRLRFEQLSVQIKELNETIRDSDQAAGDFRTTIGNYKEEVEKALQGTSAFGGTIGKLQGIVGEVQGILKALSATMVLVDKSTEGATKSTNRLGKTFATVGAVILTWTKKIGNSIVDLGKKVTKTLGKTGVIGVLLALVAVFSSIGTALAKTTGGQEDLASGTAKFTATLEVFLERFIKFGQALIEVFKGVANAFNGIGKALTGNLQGAGKAFNDAQANFAKTTKSFNQTFNGFADEVKRRTDLASKSAVELLRLERERLAVQSQNRKLIRDEEALKLIRDDERKSLTERIRANEQLGKLEAQRLKLTLDLAEKDLKITEDRLKLRPVDQRTVAELTELEEKRQAVFELQEESIGRQTEQITNRRGLLQELADVNKEINDLQTERLLLDQEENSAKTFEIRLQQIEKSYQEEIKAAGDADEKIVLARERRLTAIKNLEKEQTDFQFEQLRIREEAQNNLAQTETQIELNKLERQKALLENTVVTSLEQEKKLGEDLLAIDEEIAQKQIEQLNENLLIELQSEELQAEDRIALARQTADEIAGINQNLETRKQNFRRQTSEIDKQIALDELATAQSLFANLAILAEENTQAFKILKSAETLISGVTAGIKAFESYQTIPPPAGQILGGIAVAAIASQTAGALAQINGVQFAKGGIVEGPSHAQGGVKFAVGGRVVELEGKEAVINKKSTSMFAPLLSAINVAGGGKAFASGGIVSGSSQTTRAIRQAEAFAKAPAPQPVLVLDTLSRTQARVRVSDTRSRF